jgi:polynucleotide 5'-kinase involved in rRNA processing
LNYSLKLGWTPIFCDLDLNQNEITPPGCIAATLIEEQFPNDDLVENSISFFHG